MQIRLQKTKDCIRAIATSSTNSRNIIKKGIYLNKKNTPVKHIIFQRRPNKIEIVVAPPLC
jgi:hypothetical protein